jgi:cytochrome c oxidase subunit 3
MIKKAAQKRDVPSDPCKLMPVIVGIGAVLLVIRGFEFNSLNCRWTDNAYGSIIWALLLLHTTHILTDWIDTIVLWLLMRTRSATKAAASSIPTRTRSTGATSGCCGSRSI